MLSLEHFPYSTWSSVYEPAEDTWLLIDAVAADAPRLAALSPPPSLVLELGSGSGAVCASALLSLGRAAASLGVPFSPPQCLAADLSPAACAATARTAAAHGVGVEVVQCDLLAPLARRLRGAVDVLLFNPPYVPTPAEEVPRPGAFASGGDALPAAWAGGERGREVIDRALPVLVPLLRAGGGVLFLVLVEDNAPEEVMAQLAALGAEAVVVARVKAANEHLCVVRATRVGC
jgi:release factor glutamine methyltransferase